MAHRIGLLVELLALSALGIGAARAGWAAAGLLVLPLAAIALRREDPRAFGFRIRLRPPSTAVHVLLAAAAGVALFAIRPEPPGASLAGLVGSFLVQVAFVALPEEAFFRGYWIERWRTIYGPGGAAAATGLVLQAALFALVHPPETAAGPLALFAFGVLAGWLRLRSGSIAVPVLLHGAGNVWLVGPAPIIW